jgi:hypothetical protein
LAITENQTGLDVGKGSCEDKVRSVWMVCGNISGLESHLTCQKGDIQRENVGIFVFQ